jgi:proline iminopeptidase
MTGAIGGQDVQRPSQTLSKQLKLSRLSKIGRVGGRIGLAALSQVVGLIAGVGAILGVARISDTPALFITSGLAVFAFVAAGGGILATRRLAAVSQRTWRLGYTGVAGIIALVGTLALLVPLGDPAIPATAVPGQRFWNLPTGSRIAYVKIPAVGTPKPTPIIFVHGGPGFAQMAVDAPFFGQLARDGYDVYLYDQIGAGLSPRLDDPTQYTVARAVADLEAIRQQIGAGRVILIGHSWGGTVAATYLAEHPGHVEKVIFSSPGAVYWPEMGTSGMGMVGRLTSEQRWQVIKGLLPPRALMAYALVQVNPRAAHAFVGDRELDAHYDQIFASAAPGLFCDVRNPPPGEALTGVGFYANQIPQSTSAARPEDPRPMLRVLRTPALVLKGSCDYVPWRMTLEYRDTLPNAQLVYLPGSGHQAYMEQPDAYLATVRAFLHGAPLPVQPYTGHEPPSGYSGAR